MKRFTRLLLTGLLTVLPIVVTIAVLVWLASTLEKVLGGVLQWMLPEGVYATGMGFTAGLLLVFVVGLVMSSWLVQRVFERFEAVFLRVPVLNTLYGAVKDFTALFSPDKARQFASVVAFRLPGTDAKLIGFVTRDDTEDLPGGLGSAETVAVYLPMSYQIGGYMLLLPREQLEKIDMPVHEALRFTLTAGVSRSG
jgi:uncharacterized membrane protein